MWSILTSLKKVLDRLHNQVQGLVNKVGNLKGGGPGRPGKGDGNANVLGEL